MKEYLTVNNFFENINISTARQFMNTYRDLDKASTVYEPPKLAKFSSQNNSLLTS